MDLCYDSLDMHIPMAGCKQDKVQQELDEQDAEMTSAGSSPPGSSNMLLPPLVCTCRTHAIHSHP